MDPLTDDYPHYTPYQYAGNEPIANVDLDGLEQLSSIFNDLQGVIVTSTKRVAKKTLNLLNQVALHTASLTAGAINAYTSNQLLGVGRADAVSAGWTNSYGLAFQIGQKVGDAFSMITGAAEATGGVTGELASFGVATPIAIPLTAHGLTAGGLGLYHLINGKIVYSSPVSPPLTTKI